MNNHLCVLRKLLNLAVEWGELSHAPRVKQLRVAHGDFQLLGFEETPRLLRAAAPEWKAFYAHLSPNVKRDAVRLLDDVPPRVPSSPAVTAGEGELRSP